MEKGRSMSIISPEDTCLLEPLIDANRSRQGWHTFLDAFRQHFNVHSCHLYIANMQTLAPRFQDWAGAQPNEIEMKKYMEQYFETDYTHIAILRGEPHCWYASNLMPNQEEIESAPAFVEWAIPNNIHYVCGSTLFRDNEWSCVFVSNRRKEQAGFTPQEVERMHALSPFIEKAVRLRLQIAENQKDHLRLKAVLNHFRLPVATLNEFGEVIAKNHAMDQFIKQQSQFSLDRGSHLRLNESSSDKQLQMSISQTISSAKGRSLEYSNQALEISESGAKKFSIGFQELLEQDESSNDIFIGALVFIADEGLLSSTPKQKLQRLFSLTEAESQVAHLFSRCISLRDISIQEGKSINTVREQIQNCFKKTNTKNQLELINLIASLPISEYT